MNATSPMPDVPRSTRHRLVRRVSARCAAGALAALVLAVAQAQHLPGIALGEAAAADPSCAELQALGPCQCGPFACGVLVTQYVPVAFIETTRAPGDSLLGGLGLGAGALGEPPGLAGASASSSLSTTDNTAEAHVWIIPDSALPPALCAACRPSAAMRPAPPGADDAPQCGSTAAVTQALSGALGELVGRVVPVLAYASEADMLNWRTGCRDLAAAPVSPPSACRGGVAAAAALVADDDDCLGAWGPLKPRQMRDIGPPPVLYSAKTAVRAMSVARTQLGTFPYPVDVLGKLQQVYPVASACFRIGALPLPRSPWSARPTQPSADGRYGWLYWRRTTCCVRPTRLAQCLRAGLPVP
jgi:hypothetical protein